MKKTMVVWRKLGREHDERGYLRVNRPKVVSAYLQDRINRFQQLPEEEWRWWQLSEEVIVEKPLGDADQEPARAIYHLPRRKWAVVEDAHILGPGFDERWHWCVHIGEIAFDSTYDSWIFTDHFCDVMIQKDMRTHTVLHLDDLGTALQMKLIKPSQAAEILTNTQKLLHTVRLGGFPPKEICELQKTIDEFGWSRQPE